MGLKGRRAVQRSTKVVWAASATVIALALILLVWGTTSSLYDRIAALAAIGVWLQAIAVIIALVVAFSQLAETRRLRLETLRPFVVVTLESRVNSFADIVITNIGPIIAKDVTFIYEKPLRRGTNEEFSGAEAILDAGLPSLAPGQSVDTIFEYSGDRPKGDETLPTRWKMQTRYYGPDGRPFKDDHVLDLTPFLARLYIERNDIHHVHAEIKRIRERFERIDSADGAQEFKKWVQAEREADANSTESHSALRPQDRALTWLSGLLGGVRPR